MKAERMARAFMTPQRISERREKKKASSLLDRGLLLFILFSPCMQGGDFF
jgi:hypothetical protein